VKGPQVVEKGFNSSSVRREQWRWLGAAILFTAAGILVLHVEKHQLLSNSAGSLLAGLLALGLVAGITALSLVLRHGVWVVVDPLVSTLATITLRFLTVLLALGLATATKWNHSNSFCYHLLGCYFIFLILESWLASRWHSSRSQDHPS
jgi:hypothetical protein